MADLNGDLGIRVSMHSQQMEWQASPSPAVFRKRLHRVGETESGEVTSFVRYAPGAAFPAHDHPDGEEILVLAGVFSDECGDWGVGSYLLNPEGYRHAPFSRQGCDIFVKLRQYGMRDVDSLAIDTLAMEWRRADERRVDVKHLHDREGCGESTRLERWTEDSNGQCWSFEGGVEVLVLEGGFIDSSERFEVGSWLRLPPGGQLAPHCDGTCVVYLKRGGVARLVAGR